MAGESQWMVTPSSAEPSSETAGVITDVLEGSQYCSELEMLRVLTLP